jgi:hypothetical protein
MGSRSNPGSGILLIDSRLIPSAEEAQGTGTRDSQYTQAEPGPGTPDPSSTTSRWRPSISGAQSVAIDTITISGGYPGREGLTGTDVQARASVLYRLTADTAADDYRGWDEPSCATCWSSVSTEYGSGANVDEMAACTIPDTQEIVIVCTGDSTADPPRVYLYNPRAETWTAQYDFGTGSITASDPITLVWDPDAGHLILFTGEGLNDPTQPIAYYSTDKGATWSLYSRGGYRVETYTGRIRVAAPVRSPWLMQRAEDTAIATFYSLDHGVNWTRVDEDLAVIVAEQADLVALPSGGFLSVYIETTTADLTCRRLPSATTPWTSGTQVDLDTATNWSTVAACVDYDGIVYVFATEDSLDGRTAVYRSLDEGLTWDRYDSNLTHDNANTAYLLLEQAVAANGAIHLAHRIVGTATLDQSGGLLTCGGWGTTEAGTGVLEINNDRIQRIGTGNYTGSGTVSSSNRLWLPFDLPLNMGWGETAGGATASFITDVGMRVTAAANNRSWNLTSTHRPVLRGEFEIDVISGGSTSDKSIAVLLRMADGTYDYQASIRFTTISIGIYDEHGGAGTIPAQLPGNPSDGLHVRYQMHRDSGAAQIHVWARAKNSTNWWPLVEGTALTDKGAAFAVNDRVEWGHIDVGTGASTWRMFSSVPDGDWRYKLDSLSTGYSDYETGPLGLQYGHTAPPLGTGRYPIPDATTSSQDAGWIAGQGIAAVGEVTSHPVAYGRAITNVYPTLSPSPSQYWESTDATEVRITWDLTGQTYVGDALGLLIHSGYARQWTLEYDDGGAGWTTAGTLDLAIGTSLNATRAGDTIIPRSGSAAISRYIGEGELVGGYVLISTAGSDVARRIVANTGGHWVDSAATQQVRIRVEGIDGTEHTSTAVISIVAPSGLLIVYPTAGVPRRYWRVKAAASQTTPGSVYRAGLIAVGRIAGVGADPGWDWSRRLELRRTVTRDRRGTPRIRQLSAPVQVWSTGWTDGLHLLRLRESTTPDYFGTSTGLPIATTEDPWHSFSGWLANDLDSGAVPCVWIPRLPTTSGTTITDPTLWVYGVIMAESIGVSGVVGTEGTDELVRLDSVTFEEIK